MHPTPTNASDFPCAQCGADLRYAPGEELLVCSYCGHGNHIDIEDAPIQELDFRRAVAEGLHDVQIETTTVAKCKSCGAAVEFDPNLHADECPFCAGPLITSAGEHRHFKPKAVLPFAITDTEAKESLVDWLGNLWFAPSALKKYARANKAINGLYTPYWTFDADTESAYEGQRGDIYYVERVVTVMTDKGPKRQRQRIPKIRWTPVRGRVARFFDDVLVLGSKALPKRLTDNLAPWDLHALLPYQPDYLAGFRAEAYTIDLREGFAEARAVMDLIIRRDVRFDIGGDQQQVTRLDTEFGDVTFKHILLPVWIAAYRYRGKTYRFVVNGRSGKVQGERPYSAWKIIFAVIAGAVFGRHRLWGALRQRRARSGHVRHRDDSARSAARDAAPRIPAAMGSNGASTPVFRAGDTAPKRLTRKPASATQPVSPLFAIQLQRYFSYRTARSKNRVRCRNALFFVLIARSSCVFRVD